MFPDTTYISLGISPDAATFVLQPVIPDGYPRPFFAYAASIAELNSRGRAEAIHKFGSMMLCSMRTFFPVINVFAESLIPEAEGVPLTFDPEGDHTGTKRSLHLRISAINGNRSVVVRRFNNDDATSHEAPTVMLEPLMAVGPHAVVNSVGAIVLAEFAALYPEVFAPFRELLAS
ncbi:hypothetical protein [Massilia sp. TWP1-3-3]|uniref:hypothetical protein n=1 Tax=Massilia sp. TWP1-3-3 TaxID=2804573 RepID=UPI003CF27FA7